MGWVWARCSLCRSHTVTGLESCPLPKEIGAQLQAVCLGLEVHGGDGLMVGLDNLRCPFDRNDPVIQTLFPSPPQKERIREKFVAALQREFAGKGLRFSRGEQRGL